MDRDTFYQTRLFNAPSSLALNTARSGIFTTSLQCLTTITLKNLFHISKFPLYQFEPVTPCPITTAPDGETLSSFPVGPLQVL